MDVVYYVDNYCYVFDATVGEWIPFNLWPEQITALRTISENRLLVILKARQLGMTWLCLAFNQWLMMFRPITESLIFSRRETDAIYLLDDRAKGLFEHQPDWLKGDIKTQRDSKLEWSLSNKSVARAFPTSAGDSYTAKFALVDEADLVPDLNHLMNAVKPTIDGGGRLILLSRAEKEAPLSEFKRVYRAAKEGGNGWTPIFLPWYIRPERDQAWYEEQKADILSRTGALDDLYKQYPATDKEALSPAQLNKRLPGEWLRDCYEGVVGKHPSEIENERCPSIEELFVFCEPVSSDRYVIGADPAEGNPTSDDSSMSVVNASTLEEVAVLKGKFQPHVFAAHIDRVGQYYNNAPVLPESNNHGHVVILWLKDYGHIRVLNGWNDKSGWLSSSRGKTWMYDAAADVLRRRACIIHSITTYAQLSSIEGTSLRAPVGQMDDVADSWALAIVAVSGRTRKLPKVTSVIRGVR